MIWARRRRILPLMCCVGLAGAVMAPTSVNANSPNCANSYCHWYVRADFTYQSAATGDGASTWVWSQWSADHYDSGFADVATWLENWNGIPNDLQSIEGGYYTGFGRNIPWTNSTLPYDTYSNGTGEHDVNTPLTAGAAIWMAVAICAGCGGSIMQVGSYVEAIDGGAYQIASPRYMFAQAEVGGHVPNHWGHNTPATWMCGGDGIQLNMEWGNGSWQSWDRTTYFQVDAPYVGHTNTIAQWDCSGFGSE